MQWASKRARGRAGDGEFVGDGGRSPKRGTTMWRRCRASGDSWSGGEEEGVVAELLSRSGERGVVGDGGYGERRRRWCSVGRGERARESRGRVNGVSARSGRRPEDDPRGATATRAMQRGWVVRGELGRAMLTSLPALARGSSWLARASTVLGRLGWAGRSR